MLPLLQVVVLLAALLATPASFSSVRLEDFESASTAIGLEDISKYLLLSFKPGIKFIDVFVPPHCLKNNAALFKAFMNTATQSLTLWTNGKRHFDVCNRKPCLKFRQMFLSIVYFICGEYDFLDLHHSTIADYAMSFFVAEESARHRYQDDEGYFQVPFLPPYPRASGRYVMSITNSSVFLTGEFKVDLVSHQNLAIGIRAESQRKLSGASIRLACTSSYSCHHPSFNMTVELLMYRNASVSVKHYKHLYIYKNEAILSTDVNSMGHGDTYESALSTLNALDHFGSAGFSFYVRKRDRVPKEAIFFLPFLWEVWVGLVASCVLIVLSYNSIIKVMLHRNVSLSVFIFTTLAAFFQQSIQLHSSLLMTQYSRLMYGLMALMFVVMSTAFKGRLTSLLNDLPLQGAATQFLSFEDIISRGNRLCILEQPGIYFTAKGGGILLGGSINVGYKCYETLKSVPHSSRSIKIADDGRDTFFTCNSRTGPSEALRRELLERGYVETEGTAFSYPVGPEMRTSSVYRHDFGVTLSRGIQAGLYVRHAALAEYKSRSLQKRSSESAEEQVLNLRDLRPFFLAWFVGMTLSVLAFVGEVVLARVMRRSCTDRVRLVLKQPSRRKLPKPRVTKEKSSSRGRKQLI